MAELTRRQRRALAGLLSEPSIRAAAVRSKIAERTLYRWLTEPVFRATYRTLSRRLLEDSIGRLRATAGEAVETLQRMLKAESDTVKVSAARAILDTAVKVDVDDLAARIETLEAMLLPRGNHGSA